MGDAPATVKVQVLGLCSLLPQIWGRGCGPHPGSRHMGCWSLAPLGGLGLGRFRNKRGQVVAAGQGESILA